MELRPKVWDDFLSDLKTLKQDENYQLAIEAKTNITCFNDWVQELKTNNYLHNHARMWFASIWIFTLKLPWQLGAAFFMKYLLDGDAAANTLSWRWVGGLQTKGKHYVAQAWNIAKFTNNKYQNIKLNEQAQSLEDNRNYAIQKMNFPSKSHYKYLLFFENDLNLEKIDLNKYQSIFSVLLENKNRKLDLDNKLIDYKIQLMDDQLGRLKQKVQKLTVDEFLYLIKVTKEFDVIYPGVGENLTFLKEVQTKENLSLNYILRSQDLYCYQFSNKGFFNFKKHIPKIISEFKLN